MKLKDGFILSAVGGEWLAAPVGANAAKFHGVIRLNESGAYIWRGLAEGLEPKKIAENMRAEYDGLDAPTAERAVASIVEKLRANGILED